MLPSVDGSTTGNGLGVDALSFRPTGIIGIVVITLGAFNRSSSLICKGTGRLLNEVMLLLLLNLLIPKDTRVEGGNKVNGRDE